jgi:hypothetical protein
MDPVEYVSWVVSPRPTLHKEKPYTTDTAVL